MPPCTYGSQLSGQPGGVTLLLLLCGTQRSDSGHQSGQVSAFVFRLIDSGLPRFDLLGLILLLLPPKCWDYACVLSCPI